ncbi:hypothetical protein WT13_13090 [Burkholderia anthina]|nr:hypothetical protein WT13_13090 [Burkholderia anthina]
MMRLLLRFRWKHARVSPDGGGTGGVAHFAHLGGMPGALVRLAVRRRRGNVHAAPGSRPRREPGA